MVSDHEHRDAVIAALVDRRLGLAGHPTFATFSVFTRLPPPLRRTSKVVGRLLSENLPASRLLTEEAAAELQRGLTGQRTSSAGRQAWTNASGRPHQPSSVSRSSSSMAPRRRHNCVTVWNPRLLASATS